MTMKKIIITILAPIALSGCALTSTCHEMPVQPTKPNLPSLKETPSNGIELDQRDAGELMRYILDLERGYKQ